MKKYLTFTVVVFFIFSCKKNTDVSHDKNLNKSNSVYKYIQRLGYNDNEIKDIGNEFLVDGDMLFDKNINLDFSIFGGPKAEQYGTSNYVGYNVQPNITVRIDPSMNAFTAEINGALALWNNVANCRVKFMLTNATNQNILVTNYNLGSNVCGATFFPINGQPGASVRININLIAGNPFLQRQRTIAHELGHSIGFRHTDWLSAGESRTATDPNNGAFVDAMQILGTPNGNDLSSLMNSNQCGIGATALSNFDLIAVQFLYPANPPVTGTVPVFRYFSRIGSSNHFYTTNLNELQNGSNSNYIFEGIGFFAFSSQINGTVPVYRYFQNSNGDHLYTTNFNELGSGSKGYVYEGIRFYAYPSALNGSVPVFRYFSNSVKDHFYTKNENEFFVSNLNYTFESTAFYAY